MSFSLFISDLHLSDDRPDITSNFLTFLEQQITPDCDRLFILGDFFDYWVGDDLQTPLTQQVATVLSDIAAQGVRCYFLPGNRDFIMGKQYLAACGLQLLPDPYQLTLYQQRYLLLHGDSLCTDDHQYQKVRKRVRNPIVQWCFLRLPLSFRQQYADNARLRSKNHQQQQQSAILDVNQTAVEQTFIAHHIPIMIHGHTHRKAIHHYAIEQQQYQRIVLGDWHQEISYLQLFSSGEYTLV